MILVIDLLPEQGTFWLADHEARAQPHMLAIEYEGFRSFEPARVAIQDARANRLERNLIGRRRQRGAGRQPQRIEDVGHFGGFVVVVDAPDDAAFLVGPGAENFQMDVADRQHSRSVGDIGTKAENGLGPAPIGGAQKGEGAVAHPLPLFEDIFFDNVALDVACEPALVVPVRRPYDHGRSRRARQF
jgi:hypothetical protein